MAQQLRGCAALGEDPSLVPSTSIRRLTATCQPQEHRTPLICGHCVQILMHVHIIKNFKLNKQEQSFSSSIILSHPSMSKVPMSNISDYSLWTV